MNIDLLKKLQEFTISPFNDQKRINEIKRRIEILNINDRSNDEIFKLARQKGLLWSN